MRKQLAIKILEVTGYLFPKEGIFGRDTRSRAILEALIGCSLVKVNWGCKHF